MTVKEYLRAMVDFYDIETIGLSLPAFFLIPEGFSKFINTISTKSSLVKLEVNDAYQNLEKMVVEGELTKSQFLKDVVNEAVYNSERLTNLDLYSSELSMFVGSMFLYYAVKSYKKNGSSIQKVKNDS